MKSKIRIMRLMLLFSTLLLGLKFFAWWITRSNAILTDALESIVNVVAGAFALFSISYAARPRDAEHPYGHGKIEFVSAGFEGALVLLAGCGIIYQAIHGFIKGHTLEKADIGAVLSAASGAANFVLGRFLIVRGKKQSSPLMEANGRHLVSDTVSSIGLVAGLVLIWLTGLTWLDNALAIGFGLYIFYTGSKIVRESLGNLLDEQDQEKVKKLVEVLNENRRPAWIDMHNLRVVKYGSVLHVDAHITLPWYFSLVEAHDEVHAVEDLVKEKMGEEMEFFIHADPCLPMSCSVGQMENCNKRRQPFVRTLKWTEENIKPDHKHTARDLQ